MDAESEFMQGRFADAAIELERAYAQIAGTARKALPCAAIFYLFDCPLPQIGRPQFSIAARPEACFVGAA